MSTKTPKPRVMWAIYDNCADPIVSGNRSMIRICERKAGVNAIRVAVIPLDDVEAIVERAADAYADAYRGAPDFKWTMQYGIRAALTAAGIPCAKRKARK